MHLTQPHDTVKRLLAPYLLTTVIMTAAASSPDGNGNTSRAHLFCRQWMSHPEPDDMSMVWFRKTFVAADKPSRAFVSIATTGLFTLYVNGRNVSTACYMPQRTHGASTTAVMDFDIARFLRKDSNTVAVLYAPLDSSRQQLAVTYHGITRQGQRFAHTESDGWLCRKANSRRSACGGEVMDARLGTYGWSHGDLCLALWLPVYDAEPQGAPPLRRYTTAAHTPQTHTHATQTQTRTLQPDSCGARIWAARSCKSVSRSDRSVVCDFSPGFYGLVRVTIRGARKGERIDIGPLHYFCNGQLDEQAYLRFTPFYGRKIEIKGDSRFSSQQITEVEVLETY